jgi:triosephosphate isomerase (TIM)
MSRQKIVAGNWKMNLDFEGAVDLVRNIKTILNNKYSDVVKIICPAYPYLNTLSHEANDKQNFFIGAQNCSGNESGAFTGEVSAAMLKSVNCNYVLIGHSERRQYFNEDSTQIILKVKQAFAHKIKVIFCFGEKLEARKNGTHLQTVSAQISETLQHFMAEEMDDVILAYEPVWAIGTGETATAKEAQEMHAHVRTVISELFSKEVAGNTSILYGGSCNAKNASELFACEDVDGGLIGGASLKAEEFCKIIGAF